MRARGASGLCAALAAFLSAACEASPDFYLDLRTDYRAGLDFTLIQVRRGDEVLALARADGDADFSRGARVARLRGDELGTPVVLDVELLDRDQARSAGEGCSWRERRRAPTR